MTQAQKQTAGSTVASLVLGILGFVFFGIGIVFAIPAVICGHVGLSSIRKSDGALGGGGMAIAGLVMGYLVLAIFPLLLAIAIPSLMKARTETQRMLCSNNMKTMEIAWERWAVETNSTGSEPIPAGALEQRLPNGAMPVCPNSGEYEMNPQNGGVSCSVHGTIKEIMTSRHRPASPQPASAW